MRQEATEFQSKIEAECNDHKARFDEAFRAYAERFDADPNFDAAFTGSVAEPLHLARNEGARIAADAMVAAEEMDHAGAPAAASYDLIRDAVNDISSKDSQSSILKSLVHHAAEFAPRGAFFIIKSEHFAGWKVFGTGVEAAENAIREVHFPTSADSILGAAAQSLSTVDASPGAHSEDVAFLEPLQFGRPDRMYAVPLVARGRSVAVLYADHGSEDGGLNREALETLVRVAGLTVELLASSQTAKAEDRTPAPADFEDARHETDDGTRSEPEPSFDETVREMPSVVENGAADFAFSDSVSFQGGFPQQPEIETSSEAEPEVTPAEDTVAQTESVVEYDFTATEDTSEISYTDEPAVAEEEPSFEQVEDEAEPVIEADSMDFDSADSVETPVFDASPFDQSADEYAPAAAVNGGGYNQIVEPVIEAPAASGYKTRLSDRPVDLPIEVPDEERRVHIDARRFARLLVSEIKLYNEKKVIQGRESQDLYDRLREAIDRSREMYDKRVQPGVAAKFDYFDYELVNSLAEGDATRLGGSYPGSSV